MRNWRLIAMAALAAGCCMIMSTGCKKGDTGPAGPAGPDSVQYSAWKALSMSYAGKDNSGDSVFTQTIAVSAITSAIVNKGSVIGYLLVSDPITGDSSVINASLALQEFVGLGKIDIVSYGTDWTGYDYRYVIIPGKIVTSGVSGAAKSYTGTELNQLDYTILSNILKIPATGSSLKLN